MPLAPGVKFHNFTSIPTSYGLKVQGCLDRYLAAQASKRAGRGSEDPVAAHRSRMLGNVEQRNSVFDHFYYNSKSGSLTIDAMTNCKIKELLAPGSIRTGNGSMSVFRSQSTHAKRLSRSAWPTVAGRPAWPSSPNITEWLEMILRGVKPSSDHWVQSGKTTPVTRREFNENIELARLIVVRQIIGLRADVEVERKFLKYFRYRWGFLILTYTNIPAGLVRRLASIWIKDPYSLWLERKVSLRKFLRQVPTSILNRVVAKKLSAREGASAPEQPLADAPAPVMDRAESEHRPFTKAADWDAESYSVHSSELD